MLFSEETNALYSNKKMANKNRVEEISGNGFEEKIKKGVFVVDFYAEWCMPCVMMSPVIEELADKLKKMKFMKVNVDDNKELARKFKVMSIPTIMIFKNGKEAERVTGSMPSDILEEKLRALVK